MVLSVIESTVKVLICLTLVLPCSLPQVFGHLFCLQLEEDVNEVLFAMKSDTCFEENILQAVAELEKILQFEHPERIQSILKTAEKIKRLK